MSKQYTLDALGEGMVNIRVLPNVGVVVFKMENGEGFCLRLEELEGIFVKPEQGTLEGEQGQ